MGTQEWYELILQYGDFDIKYKKQYAGFEVDAYDWVNVTDSWIMLSNAMVASHKTIKRIYYDDIVAIESRIFSTTLGKLIL